MSLLLTVTLLLTLTVSTIPPIYAVVLGNTGAPLFLYIKTDTLSPAPLVTVCITASPVEKLPEYVKTLVFNIEFTKNSIKNRFFKINLKFGNITMNATCIGLLGEYTGKYLFKDYKYFYVDYNKLPYLLLHYVDKDTVIVAISMYLIIPILLLASIMSIIMILYFSSPTHNSHMFIDLDDLANTRRTYAIYIIIEEYKHTILAGLFFIVIALVLYMQGYPTLAGHTLTTTILLFIYFISIYIYRSIIKYSKTKVLKTILNNFIQLLFILNIIYIIIYELNEGFLASLLSLPLISAILLPSFTALLSLSDVIPKHIRTNRSLEELLLSVLALFAAPAALGLSMLAAKAFLTKMQTVKITVGFVITVILALVNYFDNIYKFGQEQKSLIKYFILIIFLSIFFIFSNIINNILWLFVLTFAVVTIAWKIIKNWNSWKKMVKDYQATCFLLLLDIILVQIIEKIFLVFLVLLPTFILLIIIVGIYVFISKLLDDGWPKVSIMLLSASLLTLLGSIPIGHMFYIFAYHLASAVNKSLPQIFATVSLFQAMVLFYVGIRLWLAWRRCGGVTVS